MLGITESTATHRRIDLIHLDHACIYSTFQILIDNKQHYKVFGKPVDIASLITLDVEDGKVVRHQDW
jgi:hypothetical protein